MTAGLISRTDPNDSGPASLTGRRASSWQTIWLTGLGARSPQAFAFALACVALATAVHLLIGLVRPDTVVFAPYYAATLIATLVGGSEAGGLAVLVGGAIAYTCFAPPEWKFALLRLDLVNWALYGTSSAVIVWAAASYRGLVQRLREEEHKRELLNRELAHRLRNTLASVQSILNQSLAGEQELLEKIKARLTALAATNDLLVDSGWRTASLKDILIEEFKPYDLTRIAWRGEEVQCPAEAATMLALMIHELATNAVKYGALSTPHGRVDIAWRKEERRLILDWDESGNLHLAPPSRKGFGTRLLHSAARAFHGSVETSFRPNGLCCRISLVLPEARPVQS
jgi:two-component sensor histidine kinase